MCQAGNDCIHGVCINGRCTEPRCGDGVQNGNEQCDDGNIVNNDGCEANCTLPSCGNGVIDPEASCDCGPGLVNLDNNPDNGCECGLLANLDLSCDGVDDDCDGRFDEDYTPPAEIRGQCGQFDGPCDRSGVVAVTRLLCANGSVVEDNLEEVCARATDGIQVRLGNWSECGGFDGVCAEDGRQDRTRVVCRNGREINEPDSQMCTRDTDGVIANHGNWGRAATLQISAMKAELSRGKSADVKMVRYGT